LIYFRKFGDMSKRSFFYKKTSDYSNVFLNSKNLLNDESKAIWNNFAGYIYDSMKYFQNSVRFYQRALFYGKECKELDEEVLKGYFLILSKTHLQCAYNACNLKPPAKALAEDHYNKVVETTKEALQLPTKHQRDALWSCLAKATYGLSKLKRQEKKYDKAIDLFIESVSINIKGLIEETSSDVFKISFLKDLKNHFALFLKIFKRHKTILNDKQEKLLKEYIFSLEKIINESPKKEFRSITKPKSKLKEILTQITTLISPSEIPTASFWKKESESSNNLLTSHTSQRPNPFQ
jgi:tetratricopeptide (TPR) repeat protein